MLTFKRNDVDTISVKITDDSYISSAVMGDCTAYIEFFSEEPVDIIPGDSCIIFGAQYFVKDQIIPTRDVSRLKYQLTLYGTVHELEKVIYFISDSTGEGITSDVSWDCIPLEFLTQLIVNLNRVQPDAGWTAGDCLDAESKTITLSDNNCREALQSAADLFDTHWSVIGNVVSLIKADPESSLTLEVGMNKGIREITANKSSDAKVITRLYAYGSDKNNATGQRLSIDPVDYHGATEVIEGVKIFDEVFPQILLTVVTIAHTGPYNNVLITTPAGFDLAPYLISGQTPQITFLSGQCNGLTFSIIQTDYLGNIGYSPVPRSLPDGTVIPGAVGYEIAIGDQFEIWNITMPESFIEEAQLRLLALAEEFLQNSQQKTKLNIVCDEIYLRRNNISIALDNRITVISDIIPQLYSPGIDVDVIGFKRRIEQPWKYDTLTVGDIVLKSVEISGIQQIVEKIILKTIEVGVNDKHYTHSQTSSSASWFIMHRLGKKPCVSIINTDGSTKEGQVTYLSDNTLLITFSVSGTGYAICN